MASYWIYICTENPINRYAVSRNEYVDMQLEKKKEEKKSIIMIIRVVVTILQMKATSNAIYK